MGVVLGEQARGSNRPANEQKESIMAAGLWPDVTVQRCLFQLSKAIQHVSRYTDGVPLATAKALRARFDTMLTTAYRPADADSAATAHDDLVATLDDAAAAEHPAVARPEAMTFLTHQKEGLRRASTRRLGTLVGWLDVQVARCMRCPR